MLMTFAFKSTHFVRNHYVFWANCVVSLKKSLKYLHNSKKIFNFVTILK